MIEIQCTSCHTRYRIDERVLPDDTPTFKCSRCGHVFNADPVPARVRKPAPQEPASGPKAPESESQAPRTIRPARPRASALKSPVESDVVKREPGAEARPTVAPKPEASGAKIGTSCAAIRAPTDSANDLRRRTPPAPAAQPEDRKEKPRNEPEADDPLNRTFGDRDQKADTGENLRFDFSDERGEIGDAPPEHELERPEPHDGGWQVGDTPADFEHAPRRQAPSMMDRPHASPAAATGTHPGAPDGAPLEADMPRFAQPPPRASEIRRVPVRPTPPTTSTHARRHRPARLMRREFFSRCFSSWRSLSSARARSSATSPPRARGFSARLRESAITSRGRSYPRCW